MEAHLGSCHTDSNCVAALTPGILTYATEGADEVYVAVDEGVLVKTGPDVLVSVRRALGGTDPRKLRWKPWSVEFKTLDEREQSDALSNRQVGSGSPPPLPCGLSSMTDTSI